MTMEFEPQPRSTGGIGRTWLAGFAAAMLVAAAGGAGFGLGYALGRDRVADPPADSASSAGDLPANTEPVVEGSEPAVEDTETTAAPPVAEPPVVDPTVVDPTLPGPAAAPPAAEPTVAEPAEPSGDGVDHQLGGWSEYPFAEQPVVYSRTTESGLTVRAQRSEWWPAYLGDEGEWLPPAWCRPEGFLRITIAGTDVVDVSAAPTYGELYEGRALTMLFMGYSDGVPQRVVVVQASPEFDVASVTSADGGGDTTAVVDGLAILLLPGLGVADGEDPYQVAQGSPIELSLTGSAGERTVVLAGTDQWADAGFRQSCQPPPPALPAPGEQPPSPAAAEDEIRAAMATLYGGDGIDNDAYLDDATGVSDARDQVRESGFEAEAASAEAIVEELVFTAPDEAWFRYRIETSGIDLDARFGRAVLIDGTWRITRDTVCQDLSMAGGDCGSWRPIELPTE